ncbi:MAG TPA: amidase, partial [Candidatus Binatia bacterium]|nr:amidase [Candidatus Binatia bacterium]
MSARSLAEALRDRDISAREVMSAFLAQIGRVNPKINAIVAKLDDSECIALADQADRHLARGDSAGPL